MDLRPIPGGKLETLRKSYRKQLGIPVISDFHEALCRMGQAFRIEDMGRSLGYVIFSQDTFLKDRDPMIPEFCLDLEQTKYARTILEKIFDALSPATVMSRTDDTRGFPLLMDLRLPNEVAASLYCLEQKPVWVEDSDIHIEQCRMDQAQELLSLYASASPEDGGIPDEMALTKSLALWRHYRLVNRNQTLAVCYCVPQIEPYVTTACIVDAGMRRKGYGRYLTTYTILQILADNKKFLAVTPSENEAARGLVESLGAGLRAHFINFRP
ncbi:GNAT family N-acetyltransferase [bacterium]|nr:GNAT family N-acetyltransferase [bacterium]